MDTAESVVVLGFGITFMENPLVGLLGGMELVSEQTTLQNRSHVPCFSTNLSYGLLNRQSRKKYVFRSVYFHKVVLFLSGKTNLHY